MARRRHGSTRANKMLCALHCCYMGTRASQQIVMCCVLSVVRLCYEAHRRRGGGTSTRTSKMLRALHGSWLYGARELTKKILCAVCWCYVARRHRGTRASKSLCAECCCALELCMWRAGGTGARERTKCCVLCIAAIWARELANKLLCAPCCALVLYMWHARGAGARARERTKCCVLCMAAGYMGHES